MGRKKKQKNKSSFTFRFVKIFLVFFGLAVGVNFYTTINQYKKLKSEETRIVSEIQKEEKKQIGLQFESEYYESDVYIEEVAREQLGLIKSDERLFVNREY